MVLLINENVRTEWKGIGFFISSSVSQENISGFFFPSKLYWWLWKKSSWFLYFSLLLNGLTPLIFLETKSRKKEVQKKKKKKKDITENVGEWRQ